MSAPTASQLIRVGHSPDADDAFMFYALAKQKIPMRGFQVEHVIEDIESLNQRALRGELEVTAVSCHAYAYVAERYRVMRSGSSVGDQYGPIVVAPRGTGPMDFSGKRIGIPGKLTTAYLVLQLYARGAGRKLDEPGSLARPAASLRMTDPEFTPVFLPFDQILEAVTRGVVDFGLIIHEGQLTYGDHGLEKVLDLGVWWHEKYHLPLPLGVDIIRRDLGEETIRSFSALFKESIEYALAHRKEALEYALTYGRGMDPRLGDRFVGMYVNELTVDLGPQGEAGFCKLLDEAYQQGLIPNPVSPDFV